MLNFNTETGKPIHLDGSDTPAFYIDAGDIKFIEKIHLLYKKMNEYVLKSKQVMKEIEIDENGIPVDSEKMISIMEKEFDFILEGIDDLLGEGVSKKIFKGKHNQNLLAKFIDFLLEVVTDERKNYTGQYLKKENKGVL